MSIELFEPTQIQHGMQRISGVKITCGACSRVERVHLGQMKGFSDDINERRDQIITRKFSDLHWFVGKTPGKHRCPACVKAASAAKPFAKLEKLKEAPVSSPPTAPRAPVADAPREMSRSDRQIILAKLLDVYADEKTGYVDHWTDKTVAEDLGVPRAWVTAMREENFGPEGGNAEMREEIAAARSAIETGKQFLTELAAAKATLTSLEASAGPMRALIDKTERSIANIEKAVRP